MTVFLVGAGPGDPQLLTRRAVALLSVAEVVVYDRLVGRGVLDFVNPTAKLVDGGKSVGGAEMTQEELNRILTEFGRDRVVVRLKGGDPFIFGRGGEEAASLDAAGIAYEVVPGVSSVAAVPAIAGVPLTMRGLSSSFMVVTGHDPTIFDSASDPSDQFDRGKPTIVVLMGVAQRGEIARRLIASGRNATTPVLIVERGTTADERVIRTDLSGLGATVVTSPATMVIGDVAGLDLRSRLRLPLAGWRVVVTRAETEASALSGELAAYGARPVELPLLAFDEPEDGGTALRSAAGRISSYAWLVCTSATAVGRFFAVLDDVRALAGVKVAAVGSQTAAEFRRHGIVCDLVPEEAIGEALVSAFPAATAGARVLLPRAAAARNTVPDGLAQLGYSVDVVEAYQTVRPPIDPERLHRLADADAVIFASSSAVTAFIEAAGASACPKVIVSIGPVTSATAAAAGLTVTAEATEHTIAGTVAALVELANGEDTRGPNAVTRTGPSG